MIIFSSSIPLFKLGNSRKSAEEFKMTACTFCEWISSLEKLGVQHSFES